MSDEKSAVDVAGSQHVTLSFGTAAAHEGGARVPSIGASTGTARKSVAPISALLVNFRFAVVSPFR